MSATERGDAGAMGPDVVLDAIWLREGDAEAKRAPLGLLLVFQMNCPRSFRHALPC